MMGVSAERVKHEVPCLGCRTVTSVLMLFPSDLVAELTDVVQSKA